MCPDAHIVDISHNLSHLDNAVQAAYSLRSACPYFPEGSVHVVGIDSEAYPDEPFIAVESNRQLFICKNNGFLGLVLDANALGSAVAIAQPDECREAAGFSIMHVVPPAVKKLLQGAPVASLGEAIAPFARKQQEPVVRYRPREGAGEQDAKPCVESIVGHVLHIDSNGNVITNITREIFYSSVQDRPYAIFIHSNRYRIFQVSSSYTDASNGTLVAFFNSQGLLEVAVSYGNASHLYSLSSDCSITIKFQS
jgi:S-adenosylmethionine hydrolase